jgi:hypothetical protein
MAGHAQGIELLGNSHPPGDGALRKHATHTGLKFSEHSTCFRRETLRDRCGPKVLVENLFPFTV